MNNLNKHDNLLKNCVKELQSCLEYVSKYSGNVEEHTNKLKEIAKDYCEIDLKHQRMQKAQEATRHYFQNQNDSTDDVEQIYKKRLEEQPIENYLNHYIWKKIAASSDTNNEDTDSSEEGDDISAIEEGIIPSQFEPPVDPITKKIIQDPCRNQKCKHVYEYDSIMDHLNNVKSNKVKPRCPYIGCANKNMNVKNIVKDSVLKDQILTYNSSPIEKSSEELNFSEVL